MKIFLKSNAMVKLPFHTLSSLHERLNWFINLRWIAAISVLASVPFGEEILQFKIGFNQILIISSIIICFNIVYLLFLNYFPFKNEYQELGFAEVQIIIDLIIISFLIHYSGGIGNPFYFLYIVQVILSGILFPGIALPYINAVIAATLLTFWTVLEHLDLTSRYLLREEPITLSLIIASLAAFYITIFAGIYIINNFMNGYRSLKRIIDEKNELLEQALKERSKAFRFAAHELKSPVVAIQSTLEVAKSLFGGELRTEVFEMISKAERRSSQLIDIIKEMISVTQYNLGIEKKISKKVEWNDWLESNVNTHKALALRKNIELKLIKTKKLSTVIDSVGFEKIVNNLVGNSIRYTNSGGTVVVTSAIDNLYYGFSVKDNGIGIPNEDIEKIFEEFYRSKNARDTEQIGTGLGLNLVKEIVQASNGFITVESKLNEGSEFTVYFPRVQQNELSNKNKLKLNSLESELQS